MWKLRRRLFFVEGRRHISSNEMRKKDMKYGRSENFSPQQRLKGKEEEKLLWNDEDDGLEVLYDLDYFIYYLLWNPFHQPLQLHITIYKR